MPILLLAEHDNKLLKEATRKAIIAAKGLGGDIHLLVAARTAVPSRGRRQGRRRRPRSCSPTTPPTPTCWRAAGGMIVSLAGPYESILAAATSTARTASRASRRCST